MTTAHDDEDTFDVPASAEDGDNPLPPVRAGGWAGVPKVEWLVVAVLAMIAIALTAYMARDLWFTTDEWEFLANRTAFDLGDLTRPYGGHWTTWSVLLLRSLYNLFGVDFWPWYYIPRLVGHTLLVAFIWWVARRRGADPLVALVAYAVLLVLGASGYQRALQIGNWAVYAALIVCALVISRCPENPTKRDRLIVAGALMVGVLGNGYSVAVIGGIIGALVLARRILIWIPSILPAVLAYGVWYLTYRDDIRPKPDFDPAKILEIPSGAFRVVRSAVEGSTAFPGWLASVVVVALLVWIVLLAVRRRFDLFDSIILLTLTAGLSLLTIQRISIHADAATRLRYGYSVTVLLALALVPHIRPAKTTVTRALIALIGLGLIAANVVQMRDAINIRESAGQEARVLVVAAAGMIAAGEPTTASPSTIYSGLETDELRHLVEDGYLPDPLPPSQPDREQIIAEARGALRMSLIDLNRPRNADYEPLAGAPPATTAAVDPDGCVLLSERVPIVTTVTDVGFLSTTKNPAQALVLTWVDEFGRGVRNVDDPDVRRFGVELAEVVDTAELTLESRVGDLTVCGFS